MSPVPTTAEPVATGWVSLTKASQLAAMTPYSVIRWAMAGYIRTQLAPGFSAKYSLPDVLSLRQTLLG